SRARATAGPAHRRPTRDGPRPARSRQRHSAPWFARCRSRDLLQVGAFGADVGEVAFLLVPAVDRLANRELVGKHRVDPFEPDPAAHPKIGIPPGDAVELDEAPCPLLTLDLREQGCVAVGQRPAAAAVHRNGAEPFLQHFGSAASLPGPEAARVLLAFNRLARRGIEARLADSGNLLG